MHGLVRTDLNLQQCLGCCGWSWPPRSGLCAAHSSCRRQQPSEPLQAKPEETVPAQTVCVGVLETDNYWERQENIYPLLQSVLRRQGDSPSFSLLIDFNYSKLFLSLIKYQYDTILLQVSQCLLSYLNMNSWAAGACSAFTSTQQDLAVHSKACTTARLF